MQIRRRKLVFVGLSILVFPAAWLAWYVGGTDLLLAFVLATVVVGAGGVAFVVVDTARRNRVEISRRVSAEVARAARAVSEPAHLPSEHAEALLRGVNAANRRYAMEQQRYVDEALARLRREVVATMSQEVKSLSRKQDRLFKHAPAEIDALLQAHRRSKLDDPLPLIGGWALSPRGLLQAIDLAGAPSVSLIVECGSGTSTLFMARALELRGAGQTRLVAIEHLPEFAERTNEALQQHGLDGIAEVRLAPLEEVALEEERHLWYAMEAVADLHEIDLLLVDGPPGSVGPSARYPAYPLLRDRLSPSAAILVDDVRRGDEASIVERWLGLGGLTEERALGQDQAILRTAPQASEL